MRIIKKVAIILIITLFCIMCTKIISIAKTATIITETLRLRKEPSTDSKIVDLISEDEKVEIIEANVGDDKNWYKVKYKGNTGYVYGRYIEVNNNDNNTSNTNTNTTKPNNNNNTNNTEQNNTTSNTTNENNTVNNNTTTNTTIPENNENANNTVENNTPTENSNEENNNVGVRGTELRKPRKQRKHNFRKCGNT